MRTFQYGTESGGLRNPQTSAQLFGFDPGPHNGVKARRRWRSAVCNSFVDSTDVIPVVVSPCCSFEITCNKVNLFTNHDGTDCEDEPFFSQHPVLGEDLAYM